MHSQITLQCLQPSYLQMWWPNPFTCFSLWYSSQMEVDRYGMLQCRDTVSIRPRWEVSVSIREVIVGTWDLYPRYSGILKREIKTVVLDFAILWAILAVAGNRWQWPYRWEEMRSYHPLYFGQICNLHTAFYTVSLWVTSVVIISASFVSIPWVCSLLRLNIVSMHIDYGGLVIIQAVCPSPIIMWQLSYIFHHPL